MEYNRRRVLKTLGGALTVSGGAGIVGGRRGPEWKSETFVFRKAEPGRGKAPGAGGGSGCTETGEWDKFTSATWPDGATVNYHIDQSPDNAAVKTAFDTWNGYLGSMSFGSNVEASETDNVVTMADLDDGVLAVATVWYSSNEINRFKIKFDTTTGWGDAGETTEECSPSGDNELFDVQNVATHEVGHTIGLSHPDNADAHTMWGYATKGETLKRTLAKGDKNGANALY